MRILVTGATGFIGSHFVNVASAAGHDVTGIRRPGSMPRVPVSGRVSWLEKSLNDLEPRHFTGVAAVCHFSSHGVSPQVTTWLDAYRHNVLDGLSALLAAADAGVDRFIVCGTCFEYGPAGEEFEQIPPSAPLRPVGPYASSKVASFIAANGLAKERGLQMAYLRVFHAYGDGQHSSNFWPSLRAAAMAGADYPMTPGEQIRDFVPVADVATTFLDACVNRPLEPGRPEVRNVGSGRPTTLLAFAEHWWREWGATGRLLPGALPYRPGEVMRYVPELTL
jgi:nucleoside-diphosphate-sugar epimerase